MTPSPLLPRLQSHLVLGLGLAVFFLQTTGCAMLDPRGRYQSDDYIVYQLPRAMSSEALAKRFLKDPRRAWVIEEANPGSTFQQGKTVIIPLKEDNRAGLFREGVQAVPILSYHRFAAACQSPLCISESALRAQLDYLRDNGYRVISLSALHDFMAYKRAIPLRSVVITIDDGYRSAYDVAFPLLEDYGFTATLFIYTDFVEQTDRSLTWDQLRTMKAAGFEIGSHTVSHSDLTRKQAGESDAAYEERIAQELALSKAILDRELDQETRFLAYPYSHHNHRVRAAAEAAGYRLGLTLENGANAFFMDPLVLKRMPILEEDVDHFRRRIATLFPMRLE